MKKKNYYEVENGNVTVLPHTDKADLNILSYITIQAASNKVHIQSGLVRELKEMLEAILEDYTFPVLEEDLPKT